MRNLLYICFLGIGLMSCSNDLSENITQEELDAVKKQLNYNPIALERNGIKIKEVTNFPPFEDAIVSIESVNQRFREGDNKIEFKTKAYNLGERTVDENDHGIRLVEEGQFLGVIGSDGSFFTSMGNAFNANLHKGKNYFLGFLSRSYEMSLKKDVQSFFMKIQLDENGVSFVESANDTAMVLISPRGSYVGLKAEKLLFDFYLKNIQINQGGNYILLKVDQTEFKIYKWAPYWIEGLSFGAHSISVSLYNKDNVLISNVFGPELINRIELKNIELFAE